jgi:hypothetical protein
VVATLMSYQRRYKAKGSASRVASRGAPGMRTQRATSGVHSEDSRWEARWRQRRGESKGATSRMSSSPETELVRQEAGASTAGDITESNR